MQLEGEGLLLAEKTAGSHRRVVALSIVALLVLVGLSVPFWGSQYVLRLLTLTLMFAALAHCWNFIGGYVGYPSFGHAAFFGVGAYSTGILMITFKWPFVAAMMGGGLAGLALSMLVGPVLRVKGHYFAIATLAVAEVSREVVNNLDITGSATGLSLPVVPLDIRTGSVMFYLIMLGLATLMTGVSYYLRRSRIGHALLAIKASESAAEAVGIDTTKYKIIAFVASGGLTGLVGGAYAYWITFIDPVSTFNVKVSITMVIMAIMGGAGTVIGPLIGAGVYQIFSELTWSHFLTWHEAFLGLLMILLILLFPQGVMKYVGTGRRLTLSDLKKQLRRYSV